MSIVDYNLHKSEDFITWESGDYSKKSWIDFALVSEDTRQNSREFRILDNQVTTSDHWPVSLQLHDIVKTGYSSKASTAQKPSGVKWKLCTESQVHYQRALDDCLSGPTIPWEAICCAQPGDCDHNSCLELYSNLIVGALQRAAHRSIPEKNKPVQRPC